jgi:3'(2'), 5'-bisphosphate nucleotidase
MTPFENELNAAMDAARLAGEVIMSAYRRLDARAEAPVDVSTQTDRDSQEAILQHLRSRFPADACRAEERTSTLATAPASGERMWIVDPIDGTRGFVTKNGEFSVMIALAVNGTPVVGVVAEPVHDRTTFATRGGGCWQTVGGNVRRVAVTVCNDLPGAVMIQSHVKPGRPNREVEALRPARVIETYSAGVKLARVADGTADYYVCNYDAMNDWDLAAGHILVSEAGGRVTNLAGADRVYGRDSPLQLGGLLASNGALHGAIVAGLRPILLLPVQ